MQAISILEKISGAANDLTPNEQRLIQSIIDNPTSAALGTASDLAKVVGVHEATASRLAKKLGFESYAGFKHALREEFIPTRDTATRFEKTINETTSGTILGDLARQEVGALSEVDKFITPRQITDVAKRLMSADRIFIYGYGNAEMLALMALKRFRRFGKDAHQLSADPRTLAEQALGFRRGDVLLTFVFRRMPRGYTPLMEAAAEAGVGTIVISGSAGAMLAQQPDHLLAAPRTGDPDAFQTLTVPMAVTNAVIIAAGLTAKDASLKKLEQLGQLIERFE